MAVQDQVSQDTDKRVWGQDVPLLVLLAVVAVITLATRYRGFLTEDAAMYTLDIMKLDRLGLTPWPTVFNGELSFGYYLLHLGLYQLFHSHQQLVLLLNLTNALSSIIAVGLSLILARQWLDRTSAFYVGLLLALAPAFWQLSRYGHPAMPALAAFLASLVVLDRLVTASSWRRGLAASFVLLVVVTYALRVDTALLAGTYLGLALWRGRRDRRQVVQIAVLWGAAVVGYLLLRLAVLGYVVAPGGGNLLVHIGRTARYGSVAGSIAKNLALWVMGSSPLIALAAVVSYVAVVLRRRYRVALFLVCWLAPVAIFLPVYALDFSRIAILSAVAVTLLAVLLPGLLGLRRRALWLAGLVVASQLVSILLYPAAVRVYAPKTVYQGRHLSTVPLGFVLDDMAARQRCIAGRDQAAQYVAAIQDRDVLIVGASSLMPYRFALATARDAWTEERTSVAGIPVGVVQTERNRFYLYDADYCVGCEQPVTTLITHLDADQIVVHAVPFDTRFASAGPLLTPSEIADWQGSGK